MKRSELQNNLAMIVTLIMDPCSSSRCSSAMPYSVHRILWPPMGMAKISLTLPMISTLIILMSSWFCFRVRKNVEARDFSRARMNLNLTIALG